MSKKTLYEICWDNLKDTMVRLRAEGYKTFICKNQDYCYGIVSNGTDVVAVNKASYFAGLSLSYDYKPCKEWGSGCMYTDSSVGLQYITAKDIEACIAYGKNFAARRSKIVKYKNLDEYLKTNGSFLKAYPEDREDAKETRAFAIESNM